MAFAKNCKCYMQFGTGQDFTILHRMSGDKLVSTNLSKINKDKCSERIIQWINITNFSLDIALFFVLHKNIVEAIAKRCKSGIKCRLVLYRHWFLGDKAKKHEKYLEMLQDEGVNIRWVADDSGVLASYSRYFFIDCTETNDRFEMAFNEGAYIVGDQRGKPRHFDITKDFENLSVVKKPDHDHPRRLRFEELWEAADTDFRSSSEPGPSRRS